jgi:nucleolar GTP-binding protein
MKLNPVPNAKELLDVGFKRASKLMLPKIRVNKKRELKEFLETKIKTAANAIDDRLTGIIKQFPDIDNVPRFLQEMISIAIEPKEYKRSLGHLQSKKKLLKMILRKSTGAIHKSTNERESSKAEKAFFGRVSSIINELNSDLLLLEKARREMKEFPDIDASMPTAIIAGFPNVGKTTILKRLTGSEPEIAAYPFTTKGLQLGYFEEKYLRFQMIDTPGLLDRPTSERNAVEKKAINALKNLAGILVFVVDATGSSGYTIKEQKHLLEEITRDFGKQTIIAINKSDISSAEQIEQAKKEFGNEVLLCGENQPSELRKRIVEELKKTLPID